MTSSTAPASYDSTVHRALNTYESAITYCEDVLVPTDSLKVLLALKTSIALSDLGNFPVDAMVVAKKALLRAERFRSVSNEALTDEEIEMLQMLRDHVSGSFIPSFVRSPFFFFSRFFFLHSSFFILSSAR